MSGINLAGYTNLSKYGILTGGALTINTGPTQVINGDWYGNPGQLAIVPGSLTTGNNVADSTNALLELNQLILAIEAHTASLLYSVNIAAGTINTFSPGINYYGTGISYTGQTLTFDAGGNSNAQFFITGVAFSFTSVTFVLSNGAQACNIFWLSNGINDGIPGDGGFTVVTPATDVPGIIISTASGASTAEATFTITSKNINGHIYAKTAITINVSGGVDVNTLTCPFTVVCYAKGSLILTQHGFVPIEHIKAGHMVATKGKIYKNKLLRETADLAVDPVMWVSKFRVTNLNSKSRPICISKDALGKNAPFKDLYVSPGHSLLLNGKMTLARDLVNDDTIYQDNECENVEYYHLECEQHSAIIANGVLSESYLEVNNRDVFENSVRLRRKHDIKKMYALR